MTTFVIGYGALAVIILAILNITMFRRKRKAPVQDEAATPVEIRESGREEEKSQVQAAPVETENAPNQAVPVEEETVQAAPKAETVHEGTGGDTDRELIEELQLPPEETAGEHLSRSAKKEEAEDNKMKMLVAILLGAFVAILNQTLINVALPHMMNDFNVTTSTIQWLVTGYMLVNGIMIPLSPFLIEKFSAKQLFITGMMLFTAGAVICAAAPSFSVILAGRLVQAAGAGIIMPLMMVMILEIFPPEKRGMAMGTVGIAMMFAPALGPTLSGYIVEHYTWRLLFSIVAPIAVIDIAIAFAWLKGQAKDSNPTFDLIGTIFSTLGFGGILYGFSQAGSNGWDSLEVDLSLLVGGIFLVLFIYRCLTVENPVLNLRVFKYGVFTLTTIIGSVVNMAMFAAMVLLPVYLQNIRGFSPLEAGLLMLPGAIVMAIMSPISGAIFDRIGARLLAVTGLAITVYTTYLFTKLTLDTTYTHLMLLYIMRMFGMSMISMTITTAGLNVLPRHLYSHGTAASNTTRQVAASLGTAFLVTVMSNRQKFHQEMYSNDLTLSNPWIMEQVARLKQVLGGESGVVQVLYGMAAKQSTVDGINDAFLVATGLAALALIMAFFLKGKPKNDTVEAVQE